MTRRRFETGCTSDCATSPPEVASRSARRSAARSRSSMQEEAWHNPTGTDCGSAAVAITSCAPSPPEVDSRSARRSVARSRSSMQEEAWHHSTGTDCGSTAVSTTSCAPSPPEVASGCATSSPEIDTWLTRRFAARSRSRMAAEARHNLTGTDGGSPADAITTVVRTPASHWASVTAGGSGSRVLGCTFALRI